MSSNKANDASATGQSASVPLPPRSQIQNNPPVWPITPGPSQHQTEFSTTSTVVDHTVPLRSKCSRHHPGRRGVCCRQLKAMDEERYLVDSDVLRDIVIGLSDGLTVPFALTAGLASLGNSKVVVLGGVAELIAGAISMGIGAFLATQAERDQYKYLRSHTSLRVQKSCQGELEREVDEILGPLGVPVSLTQQITETLRKEECAPHQQNENGQGQLKFSESIGLTPFLLTFGPKHAEPIPKMRMYMSAITIGMGYFVGGLIPLIPYFVIHEAERALLWSCIVTGIILIIFGAVKTYVTGGGVQEEITWDEEGEAIVAKKKTHWWTKAYPYVYGSLSTLAVGGMAAGSAFGIVRLLSSWEKD